MAVSQSMKKTPTIYEKFLTFKRILYSAPLNSQNVWWMDYGISGIWINYWRTKHARKGQKHPHSLRYIQQSSVLSRLLEELFFLKDQEWSDMWEIVYWNTYQVTTLSSWLLFTTPRLRVTILKKIIHMKRVWHTHFSSSLGFNSWAWLERNTMWLVTRHRHDHVSSRPGFSWVPRDS